MARVSSMKQRTVEHSQLLSNLSKFLEDGVIDIIIIIIGRSPSRKHVELKKIAALQEFILLLSFSIRLTRRFSSVGRA